MTELKQPQLVRMYRPSLFNTVSCGTNRTHFRALRNRSGVFSTLVPPSALSVRSGCHELFEKTAAERIEDCKAKGVWRNSTSGLQQQRDK